jgi:hypothetical protein
MKGRSSHPYESTSRKLVPDVDALEGRLLLSRTVSFPDGSSLVFPTFQQVGRTGGALLQSGTALTIGVGQRTSNTVNISEQNGGSATVEWNGRLPQSVQSVQSILVQAGRSRHDHVAIGLGFATVFATASTPVAPPAIVFARQVLPHVHALLGSRSGATAVQTGTVLTITDNSPELTALEISSWNFGRQVQPEWTGSALPRFSDVSMVIVDIRNGMNDFVALNNVAAKGP